MGVDKIVNISCELNHGFGQIIATSAEVTKNVGLVTHRIHFVK